MKVKRLLRPWFTVSSVIQVDSELAIKKEHEKQYRRIYLELIKKGRARSTYAYYEVIP